MPWSVSESPLGRRLPVTSANAMGGYNRAMTPNPNNPMATYKRENPTAQLGDSGSPQMGSPANDPRQPVSEAALNMDADLTDQSALNRWGASRQHDVQQGQMTQGQATMGNFNDRFSQTQNKIMGGSWRGMLQALKNKGVSGLSTGAAAGMQDPGFFDTQDPSLAGVLQARRIMSGQSAGNTGRFSV